MTFAPVRHSLQYLYNKLLRDYLPRKIGVYNTVAIREPRLLDVVDHYPTKKAGLVNGITKVATASDTVVEIGAGRGVATVWAARLTEHVVAFEASERMFNIVSETVELNGVSETVEIEHALVGEDVDVWGDMGDADVVHPTALPDADLLVMDCEGAERTIIDELPSLPDRVVIEVHDCFDVPTEEMVGELESKGFTIESIEPHSPDATRTVNVVTATRN